jgi:hypothetical protein
MLTENAIREIVREEVRSALNDAMEKLFVRLKFEMLPYVSDEEQREIEEAFGEEPPEIDEKDFITREL